MKTENLILLGGLGVLGYLLFTQKKENIATINGNNTPYQVRVTPSTQTTAATDMRKNPLYSNKVIATPTQVFSVQENGGGGKTSTLNYTKVDLTKNGVSTAGKSLGIGTAKSSGIGISTQKGVVTTYSSGFAKLAASKGLI